MDPNTISILEHTRTFKVNRVPLRFNSSTSKVSTSSGNTIVPTGLSVGGSTSVGVGGSSVVSSIDHVLNVLLQNIG